MLPSSDLFAPIFVIVFIVLVWLRATLSSKPISQWQMLAYLFTIAFISFVLSMTNHTIGDIDLFGKQDYVGIAFEESVLPKEKLEFRKYYHDNFIFFDCATSLDPLTGLTKRDDLALCLQKLRAAANDIDLIVLDIIFERQTESDSVLEGEIDYFASSGKLILAKDTMGIRSRRSAPIRLSIYSEIYGDVLNEKKNGVFMEQRLLSESRDPTLPYLAYLKLSNAPDLRKGSLFDNFILHTEDSCRIYKNEFVVPYFVTSTDIKGLPDTLPSFETLDTLTKASRHDYSKLNYNYYGLNYCKEEGFGSVLDTIRQRALARKGNADPLNEYNILVFATVKGNADRHNSIFGEIYGIEFILNSFIYLQLGHLKQHQTSILWSFIFVIAFTFAHYYLKKWSEDYEYKQGRNPSWSKMKYILIKCFDELFLIFTVIAWIYLTRWTLFATNIFFCYVVILLGTKALLMVDKIKISKA
jgi:hypothetical protein